jgi:transposase
MSSTASISHITEEVIARQTPEAQAILRALLGVIDKQQQRIDELELRNAVLVRRHAELEMRVAELEQRNAELEEEVRRLRGDKTSRNSSLPPSQEHPHHKTTPPRPRSSKKRGGQPGHPKFERALIPVEECKEVIACKPPSCRQCGHKLRGDDPHPLRHQVESFPEIKLDVTEYQRHRLTCPDCGTSTCGALPVGVSKNSADASLTAFVTLLMGCFRQSKSRVALFLQIFLKRPCSPGWIVKLQKQATQAMRPSYDELVKSLPTQTHLGADESPTKEAQSAAWTWTFVATTFTLFAVRLTRGAAVLRELLTEKFTGVLSCDRAKSYWKHGTPQWCWSHLKRHFQGWIDQKDGQVKRLGQDLMRETKELFRLWHRVRDGTITRRGFQRLITPIRKKVDGLLLRGIFSGNKKLRGSCQELHRHRAWLWTFVDHEGVEPTNNASERALRHGVIWRKLSFGTQSESGSRFVETILTVLATCEQQGRNSWRYLTDCIAAYHHQKPCPSLLTPLRSAA